MKSYFGNLGTVISQFLNVVFGPILNIIFSGSNKFGDPDETMSSVLGKNIRDNNCVLCNFVCFFLRLIDKGHCKKSIENDEGSL